MMIHVMRDGQQFGPYTLEDLNAYLAQGSLLPTDQAWWEGGAAWVPMDQVPGVQLPGMPSVEQVPAQATADPMAAANPEVAAVQAEVMAEVAPGAAKKKKIIIISGVALGVVAIAGVLLFVWPGFLKDSEGGAENAGGGGTPPVGEVVTFDPTIKKIFSEHNCYDCHSTNGGKVKGKLDLDKPASVQSKMDVLMDSLTAEEPDELMPPPDAGTKLNSDELAKVKKWIDGGGNF